MSHFVENYPIVYVPSVGILGTAMTRDRPHDLTCFSHSAVTVESIAVLVNEIPNI